jgi:hypothetical protein
MRKGLKADDLGDLRELPVLAARATYRGVRRGCFYVLQSLHRP